MCYNPSEMTLSAGITNLDALYIIMWSYYDQWFTYNQRIFIHIYMLSCGNTMTNCSLIKVALIHISMVFIQAHFLYKYAELCVCTTH